MQRRTLLATAAAAALAPRITIAQKAAKPLIFVPTADLSSLDPIWTTTQSVQNHGYYVFDTLFGVDAQLRPRPQMAEGATVEDNGRTWLIRLREDLWFHDGSPVLARDCAASLARWSKRDVFGQTAATFVDTWGYADDRTLKITLKRPFPLLANALARKIHEVWRAQGQAADLM